MPEVSNFASVGDTRDRLERAGFEVEPAGVWLERARSSRPTRARSRRAVGLSKHLVRLPEELHEGVHRRRARSMGRPFDARVRAPEHLRHKARLR